MPNITNVNSYYSINLFPALENTHLDRSKDYEEVVRRVSVDERKVIEEKLSFLSDNKEVKIGMLHEALESQNWNHQIFQDENYPYYALEAVGLEEGDPRKLSRGQFATLMSYWKTSQDRVPIESMALFNTNGSINESARAIIKQTLHLVCREPIYFLSDDQIEQLFQEMAKLPPSEQQFFIIPHSEPKEVTAKKILYELGINIFSKFLEKGRFKQMIPSFGLMQAFLKVKYGRDAVEMLPVIGLSSLNDIRENGLNSTRDFAVHFPGVYLPEEADDSLAHGFEFSFHDFYHAFVASSTPAKFRSLFIQTADIVYTIQNRVSKTLGSKIQEMYEFFIDMETTPFRHEVRDNSSLNDLFWEYINSTFDILHLRSPEELSLKVKIAETIGRKIPLDLDLFEGPGQVLAKKIEEIDDQIRAFFEENPDVSTKDDLTQYPILVHCHYLKKTHPLKIIDAIWKQRLQNEIEAG